MSDLIRDLRGCAGPWSNPQLANEAADEIERLTEAMKCIALHKGAEPARDFGNCVQIARYALYPEGVKFRSKEFYELAARMAIAEMEK